MEPVVFTEREWIMAGALGVILLFNLASFFGRTRAGIRFHVALASLSLLVAGFTVLIAVTSALPVHSASGVIVFVLLAGLFKLMNQFEINK
jgi:hypothetical protein